jgi:hypothetical protein
MDLRIYGFGMILAVDITGGLKSGNNNLYNIGPCFDRIKPAFGMFDMRVTFSPPGEYFAG